MVNKQILLTSRPTEEATAANFTLVEAPVPLGKMGQRLQEILAQPVEQRPLDLYAALAGVAR